MNEVIDLADRRKKISKWLVSAVAKRQLLLASAGWEYLSCTPDGKNQVEVWMHEKEGIYVLTYCLDKVVRVATIRPSEVDAIIASMERKHHEGYLH